ncbi:PH domain-containing protein [Staphylococcus simiae]|uniref:YdbS-like PH domain-containing protein n=1 Tax=Staphylococcus simiae CCM 7213 = CCUG 51256 TaxID=911238 RepID=G5JLV4_9STAP|nr:PH domain-containing protein [Staphylococcus simiae]EHJ06830.1 hypothetical protein SS7213T_12367 [Staphylococcus simiae CCM 7213 = CCUG 51256]PNZ11136.1 hypothetical protein CD113_08655 [Staphylococcus simiae]SNV76846.1 membrane spanning protein [Staphylococcus simiae]
MKEINFMAPNAKKVMRLGALLIWVTLITIVLIAFNLLNGYLWHIMSNRIVIILSIILWLLIMIVMLLIMPNYRYHYFRYIIDEDEIRIRRGIFFVKENIIPYFRIQNIDIKEGLLMRRYQLATLTLSTAGGNSHIELIKNKQAQILKQVINEKRTIS